LNASDSQLEGSRPWEPKSGTAEEIVSVCDAEHCHNRVFDSARTPVTVGRQTQYYCPACIDREFGLSIDEVEHGEIQTRYVNPRTVSAFVAGATVMLVLASMMAW